MVAVKPGSAKKGAKDEMTLKCKNCKMNSKCICIPNSDECILRWETYEMIKRQAQSEAIKDDIKKESAEGQGIYETIRKALEKLNLGVYKNNKKMLKKIERTLNIKFEKWQKDYILSKKSEYPFQGRGTGKTLAHQVKTLITTPQKNIVINGNNMTAWSDEKHIGRTYEKIYAMQLAELSEKLRTEGLDIPKVILKSNE